MRRASFRWESEYVADGTHSGREVGVKHGDVYWAQIAIGDFSNAASNEDAPHSSLTSRLEERLLEPAPLLGSFRLEPGEELPGALGDLRARHTPRPGSWPNDFHPAIDELELVVDTERGGLLGVSEVAAGVEIARSEIVDVVVDEPIAGDLLRPPPSS